MFCLFSFQSSFRHRFSTATLISYRTHNQLSTIEFQFNSFVFQQLSWRLLLLYHNIYITQAFYKKNIKAVIPNTPGIPSIAIVKTEKRLIGIL